MQIGVYLSLCELLSEAEPVEVWGGKSDLDLVYSSMQVLHFCLQTQHVLRGETDRRNKSKESTLGAANTVCNVKI